MRAIVITRFGGPEVLATKEVEPPSPERGEVRVRVHATAVNRADLVQRRGLYAAPRDVPADILGLEFAGEVDAWGDGVTEFQRGDRVFGLVGGGAYAQYLCVHSRAVTKIPVGLGWIDAAAVPEAFITAYDAMVLQGRLAAGETVLVHAVGSGIGTAAVQIARAIGARSIGTARTADKLKRSHSLGMNEGVCPVDGRFSELVLAETGGRGVDVVLDLVGGGYIAEGLLCLAPKGRLILVGLVGGLHADLDLGLLLKKRIELRGSQLRTRPLEEKIEAAQRFEHHILPLLAKGALKPVVDRTFPLSKAADAHAYVETNANFGKVVLVVDDWET